MQIGSSEKSPLRGERLYQAEVHRDGSDESSYREFWGTPKRDLAAKIVAAEAQEHLRAAPDTSSEPAEPQTLTYEDYADDWGPDSPISSAQIDTKARPYAGYERDRAMPTRLEQGDPARVVTGEANRPIVPR
ncbi:hypothetical protein HY346_00835 [Candidatus Microgenomates bacterium]|nr:hypothetical protein [Candidatus Microgenomates bacterium]